MSKSRFAHAATWGVVTGMAAIVLALLVYLMTSPMSAWNYLSYAAAVAIACAGVSNWRKQKGGYLTFGQTYVHLLLQTIVYAAIAAVWAFVFFTWIAPDAIMSIQLMQEAKMEEQGVPQAQIDMAMDIMRKWQTPPVIAISSLFMNILLIGLIHLVVAAIMKKDPPPAQFFPPTDVPAQNGPHGNSPYGENPYSNPPQNFPPQQ